MGYLFRYPAAGNQQGRRGARRHRAAGLAGGCGRHVAVIATATIAITDKIRNRLEHMAVTVKLAILSLWCRPSFPAIAIDMPERRVVLILLHR
jgi:hypothetical protein